MFNVLLALALLFLVFGIIGGVAISTFPFLVLIMAAILALVGDASRAA
jgi:hypothetical protein